MTLENLVRKQPHHSLNILKSLKLFLLFPFFLVFYSEYTFSKNGVQEAWVNHFVDPDSNAQATALAVDAFGNVYVTGWTSTSYSGLDFATVKYNSEGMQKWIIYYDGPGNGYDKPVALAIDNSGDIYVTGISMGADTNKDYVTIKYDSNGVQQWESRYNGIGSRDDQPKTIALDKSGNVYVTGGSAGLDSSWDIVTVKYTSSGEVKWIRRYADSTNVNDVANAMAIDESGNIYVTGRSFALYNHRNVWITIKYDRTGAEKWIAHHNCGGNANALTVDNSGNVYVTGSSKCVSEFSYDYTTIKYDSTGVEQWIAFYNGPHNSLDHAVALALDDSNNIYVTGYSGDDYATVKYNSYGAEKWIARYTGARGGPGRPIGLALDSEGNIYITGWSYNYMSFRNFITIEYNSEGFEQWILMYPSKKDISLWKINHKPTAMAIDGSGNVYVTGYSSTAHWSIYTTIKYIQFSTGLVNQQQFNVPTSYVLFENYPNPFNSSTTFKFVIPHLSYVSLEIYNLIGEKIVTILSGEYKRGKFEIKWNPFELSSGVYICRIKVDRFIESKKMILFR